MHGVVLERGWIRETGMGRRVRGRSRRTLGDNGR